MEKIKNITQISACVYAICEGRTDWTETPSASK